MLGWLKVYRGRIVSEDLVGLLLTGRFVGGPMILPLVGPGAFTALSEHVGRDARMEDRLI